jgi:hypothetical protein
LAKTIYLKNRLNCCCFDNDDAVVKKRSRLDGRQVKMGGKGDGSDSDGEYEVSHDGESRDSGLDDEMSDQLEYYEDSDDSEEEMESFSKIESSKNQMTKKSKR